MVESGDLAPHLFGVADHAYSQLVRLTVPKWVRRPYAPCPANRPLAKCRSCTRRLLFNGIMLPCSIGHPVPFSTIVGVVCWKREGQQSFKIALDILTVCAFQP